MGDVDTELGHYLRLLRIKNNLTMSQTAERTGITQGYISQIENGIYMPSAKTLAKLARAYSVPEVHLLRKAGIVQMAGVSSSVDGDVPIGLSSDNLIEDNDAAEVMDLLRRGIAGLDYLTQQARQYDQLSALPASHEGLPFKNDAISDSLLLPVYDANWQPMLNLVGEPAALMLPAHFCADDESAFILCVADAAMSPLLRPGDWVVISPTAMPESGGIAAISDRRQIQLRSYTRAGDIESFMPLNPEFASRALISDSRRDRVEIVGRVLRLVNRQL